MSVFIIAVTLIFSNIVFGQTTGEVKYIINKYSTGYSSGSRFYDSKIIFRDPSQQCLKYSFQVSEHGTKSDLFKYNMALNALQSEDGDRAIICDIGSHYGIGFSGDNFPEIFNAETTNDGEDANYTKYCSEPKSINYGYTYDNLGYIDFTVITIKFKDNNVPDTVMEMLFGEELHYHVDQMKYSTIARAMEINDGDNLVLSEDGNTLSIKEKDITLKSK